jgi:hypothetical protein
VAGPVFNTLGQVGGATAVGMQSSLTIAATLLLATALIQPAHPIHQLAAAALLTTDRIT